MKEKTNERSITPPGKFFEKTRVRQAFGPKGKRVFGFLERVEKKLANKGFTDKAPAKLVEEERAKGEKYREMLAAVSARLESLK